MAKTADLRRIDAAMREAVGLHQQGRLDAAAQRYGDVLRIAPDFAEALHLLGLVRYQERRYAEAIDLIERAIRGNAGMALFHFNLGKVCKDAGEPERAAAAYAEAWRLQPGDLRVAANRGHVLLDLGRNAQAVDWYRTVLQRLPGEPQLQNGLGIALRKAGDLVGAESSIRACLSRLPGYAEAHANLSSVLQLQGRRDEAIGEAREAVRLAPADAQQWHNLGVILMEGSRFDEARAAFARALALDPALVEPRAGLGLALLGECRHEEALLHLRAACADDRANLATRQAMLCTLNYCGGETVETIAAAHRDTGRWLEAQISPLPPPPPRPPGGRIRIGYLSADFRGQSCAYFLDALLRHHDRARFEVHLYSCVRRPDEITARFRALADHWHEGCGLGERELAQLVRDDGIDLLVDLGGHTDGNRIAVLAYRPAPIQLTWLGYPNTTGMSRVDYRVSDAIADPPGVADALASETLLRLPQGFLCFSPLFELPEPGESPSRQNGYVTFGSFNNLSKITSEVIALWARILRSVPDSRLYLKSHKLDDPALREDLRARFGSLGVAADRLRLEGMKTFVGEHYLAYRDVDIALDPFPYNGTTTSCEALWLGVPVVTLCGDRHAARVGASLLTQIGAPELIAASGDDYHAIAVELAASADRRDDYRRTLRARCEASPLGDAPAFARALEAAYLSIRRSRAGEAGVAE